MVTNLPTVKENYSGLIMRLFNLFCHYGNVTAIKIFYRNRSYAALEFQNTHQATLALDNLDQIQFYGNKLNVQFSTMKYIQISGSDRNLSKIYDQKSFEKWYRFNSYEDSKIQEMAPPSTTLHFKHFDSNIKLEAFGDLFTDDEKYPQYSCEFDTKVKIK